MSRSQDLVECDLRRVESQLYALIQGMDWAVVVDGESRSTKVQLEEKDWTELIGLMGAFEILAEELDDG